MEDVAGRLMYLFTPNKWEVQPNGCWNWKVTYASRGGYGSVGTRKGGKPISSPASRVSLRIKLGRPIKPGHLACHTCDNPACVNPDHLYEGTPKDNTKDMLDRGRRNDAHIKGGLATRKLTQDQAAEIRSRVAEGAYQAALAREFGVSTQAVSDIVNGRNYGFGTEVPHQTRRAPRGMTNEYVAEAKRRVREGETQRHVALEMGIDTGTMSRIMQGKLYKDVP